MTTATDIRRQLRLLAEEHALARENGLAHNATYMSDLNDEIEHTRSAYVGAAVTEIACLRAAISGQLRG